MNITCYEFTADGLKKMQTSEELPIGAKIYGFGAGMSQTIHCVTSERNGNNYQDIVKVTEHYKDDYFSVFGTIDHLIKPLSKRFGIGFYYDDVDNVIYSASEVAEFIKAGKNAQEQIDAEKKKKREEEKNALDQLPNQYPHLTLNPEDDHKITKKNLIAELKKNFPNVKFSVRKEYYSAYNVRWSGKPEASEVRKITEQFIGYKFDWSGDYYDPKPDIFNKSYGYFKFIDCITD